MKPISPQTMVGFEALILILAREQVSEMGQMPASQRDANMLEKYRAIVRHLPEDCFDSPDRRAQMLVRLANAQTDYDGKQLFDKAQLRLKRIRNEIIPHLPVPHRAPSGTSIFDSICAPDAVPILSTLSGHRYHCFHPSLCLHLQSKSHLQGVGSCLG